VGGCKTKSLYSLCAKRAVSGEYAALRSSLPWPDPWFSPPFKQIPEEPYFLDNEAYGAATSKNALTNPDGVLYALIEQSQERARHLGILVGASGLSDPVRNQLTKTKRSYWPLALY